MATKACSSHKQSLLQISHGQVDGEAVAGLQIEKRKKKKRSRPRHLLPASKQICGLSLGCPGIQGFDRMISAFCKLEEPKIFLGLQILSVACFRPG